MEGDCDGNARYVFAIEKSNSNSFDFQTHSVGSIGSSYVEVLFSETVRNFRAALGALPPQI